MKARQFNNLLQHASIDSCVAVFGLRPLGLTNFVVFSLLFLSVAAYFSRALVLFGYYRVATKTFFFRHIIIFVITCDYNIRYTYLLRVNAFARQ